MLIFVYKLAQKRKKFFFQKIFNNNNNISLLLFYMMNRNIKYKQVCRLVLNGGDDLNKNVNSSQYSYNNNNIIN